MSEAHGSVLDMNARGDMLGWVATEFMLALPTLSGLLTLPLTGGTACPDPVGDRLQRLMLRRGC
jgi:hypothetical protein